MSAAKPRVYIFHGDDSRRRAVALQKLRQGLGADGSAALDYVHLEGEKLTLPQLQDAVLTIPFFAARRLVHLTHPLAFQKLKGKTGRKAFLGVLESVPPSTALVLEIAEVLPEKHWLRKWADAHPEIVYQQAMPLPRDLRRWIMERAREEGGQFTPSAAAELARRVENDAVWALNEVRKLLAYVNYSRPVEVEDVHEITPSVDHPDVFAMVDALALGQSERALRLLHQLLAREDAPRLWGMVVRQFRLLILVNEALSQGLRSKHEVAKALGVHPYVAQKLMPQARRFRIATLERIYRHLWEIDRAWKAGETELETALDMLAAAMGRG